MVDLDWKTKMVSSDKPIKSPRLSNKPNNTTTLKPPPNWVGELCPASDPYCSAYEQYLRLHELTRLWTCTEFPDWKNGSILKPALQALEITFRFVSTVLSDPRPYSNQRTWKRRLESLTTSQLEVIALLCEDEDEFTETPIVDLTSSACLLSRENSSVEVWKLYGDSDTTVVSQTSVSSLLPRLATWQKSEDVAQKILYRIECEMRRCPYTLGLGEPNLAGKPSLNYDAIVKPLELHALKKSPENQPNFENYENDILYTTHQILETWVYVSQNLLQRISNRINTSHFNKASSDVWLLEKIWKLLADIEDLNLLNDPDDFLRLKNQLSMKSSSNESACFCFSSTGLVEITRLSKDLNHMVPIILKVEVDPTGGPRVLEAAMKLYRKKQEFERIHVLQGLQAVEAALKRFYYSYRQLVMIVMGSLEAKGNRTVDSGDVLAQIFLEPTYFPSLDGAKTFLGDYWSKIEH